MFGAFIEAKRINWFSGGTVISPWDLEPGHYLEEWVEAANILSELPGVKARKKAQRQVFEEVRRKNKTYAPLHSRKH